MSKDTITLADFNDFKQELLHEIKNLPTLKFKAPLKQYLKSADVMERLQISSGTLQNLRINGTLPYTKLGGLIYYEADEIQRMFIQNRIHHKFKG